jgi:hypothetical protein
VLTKRYLSESLSACRVNEALFAKVSIALACQQKPYLPESLSPCRVNEVVFAEGSLLAIAKQCCLSSGIARLDFVGDARRDSSESWIVAPDVPLDYDGAANQPRCFRQKRNVAEWSSPLPPTPT